MPRPRTHVMGWRFETQAILTVEGHGLRLGVVIARPDASGWTVVAIETPGGTVESVQAVLDDHSHSVLPTQRDITSAIELAERYAKHWQSKRETAREACSCDEIGAKTMPPRRRPF